LGIQDHQAPSSIYDDKGYDREYQDSRHITIFEKEAYKIITTLKDASLQLEHKLSVLTALHSYQPSHAAIEAVQKNIQKLGEIVGQLGKLFEKFDESNTDQKTKEAYKHIYTSVSEKYLSHMQCTRRLHDTESNPPTGPESSPPTSLTYFPVIESMASQPKTSTPAALPINKDAENAKQSFTTCFDDYCLIHKGVKDTA
jgi:hypothetical protein